MALPECDECRAIINDYSEACRALAGEMIQSRLAGDQEFAQTWRQARRLKTEEDVVLAGKRFRR